MVDPWLILNEGYPGVKNLFLLFLMTSKKFHGDRCKNMIFRPSVFVRGNNSRILNVLFNFTTLMKLGLCFHFHLYSFIRRLIKFKLIK